MAFALVIIGLLMVITGARGTYSQFGQQVAKDFSDGFTYWVIALFLVGAMGYIESLKTFSRLFMALILIALVIRNQGFFDKFQEALAQGPTAPQGGNSLAPNATTGKGNSVINTPSTSAGNASSAFSNFLTGKLGLPSWLPLN